MLKTTNDSKLVKNLGDGSESISKYFKLQESEVTIGRDRVKQCKIFLINDQIKSSKVMVDVILIVSLYEGLKTFCESDSLISSTAKIEVELNYHIFVYFNICPIQKVYKKLSPHFYNYQFFNFL